MVIVSQNAVKHGFLSRMAGISGELRAPGNFFMQNKAKLWKAQTNVKSFHTTDYAAFAAEGSQRCCICKENLVFHWPKSPEL